MDAYDKADTPTSKKYVKIRVLNIGCTPPNMSLKSNKTTFFLLSSFRFFLLVFGFDCNTGVSSSFVFQVILFAAHARVDALTSKRNSARHPNFDTVK